MSGEYDAWHDPKIIATDLDGEVHYVRAVLRDDQLDLIRQIVREELGHIPDTNPPETRSDGG